jgi:hypothetical protein
MRTTADQQRNRSAVTPRITRPLLFLAALFAFSIPGCGPVAPRPATTDSVLRVTATIQYPDLHRPWLKKQPFTRAGLATVIGGGRLLVTADLVAHSTDIELEKPEDGPKGSAVIEAIDEECNLAVLRPAKEELLRGTVPLELSDETRTGSRLDILQLESNGTAAFSESVVTTVAVMPYPADHTAFLLYRAAGAIPQREGSFVVPALLKNRLAGLVMRYDPRTQTADIIPAPLIKRFLKESGKPGYAGLARAGLTWESVRGSTLREWLGTEPGTGGVYVTSVDREGPAEMAGLKKGDLILKVNGKAVDGEGNYTDPLHGKIAFSNLATLGSAPGDRMHITYFRSHGEGSGERATAVVTLAGRNPASEISPSLLAGDSVPHVFLGGLLFQELSRPYLREWGPDWRKQAPHNLLCLDAFQNEFPRDQKRFVILSSVLPTPETIGLGDLENRLVERINGRRITCLDDVLEAARHPEKGFDRIELEGAGGTICLDAATLPEVERLVREHYGIPGAPPESIRP